MQRWFRRIAPGVVLCCAAGLHTVPTTAQDVVPQQAVLAVSRTDQNWHAFWDQHLGAWQGRWTRYSPSGDVIETFQSTRAFTADLPRTAIEQVNSYVFPDGRRVQKQWTYNRDDQSLATGFAHPASATMRGLAFSNGAAAWLVPTPQPQSWMPFELFLKQGDLRQSVGVVYGKDGRLVRTASIREGLAGFPGQFWSDRIGQEAAWSLEGDWVGKGELMRADLSRSPLPSTTWKPWEESQALHYLPDKTILSCPDKIQAGQPFSLTVIWMIEDDLMQSIAAEYDQDLELIGVTHRTWKRQS